MNTPNSLRIFALMSFPSVALVAFGSKMMRTICLTLLLTFTSLVAMSAAERDARWAVKVEQAGLPNLHRVTADIYRCAQPTAEGLLAA